VEVVASLSQGRTAAAQCGLFTHKSVPLIFEPPCTYEDFLKILNFMLRTTEELILTHYFLFLFNRVQYVSRLFYATGIRVLPLLLETSFCLLSLAKLSVC